MNTMTPAALTPTVARLGLTPFHNRLLVSAFSALSLMEVNPAGATATYAEAYTSIQGLDTVQQKNTGGVSGAQASADLFASSSLGQANTHGEATASVGGQCDCPRVDALCFLKDCADDREIRQHRGGGSRWALRQETGQIVCQYAGFGIKCGGICQQLRPKRRHGHRARGLLAPAPGQGPDHDGPPRGVRRPVSDAHRRRPP